MNYYQLISKYEIRKVWFGNVQRTAVYLNFVGFTWAEAQGLQQT